MVEMVQVSSTVSPDGRYQFFDTNSVAGNRSAKWPRKDPDAVADEMQEIFSIAYCRQKMMGIIIQNDFCPNRWPRDGDLAKAEMMFLRMLHVVLAEKNIQPVIKAVGRARRASKKPWVFTTSQYLIYAKDSGLLLKLIGLDNIENDVWQKVIEAGKPGHGWDI